MKHLRHLRRHLLMPLLAVLLGALAACQENQDHSQPKEYLKLRLVHGPELRSYLNSMREQFMGLGAVLPDGRFIDVELISQVGLTAANGIADGSIKIDAWIASSRSLVEYVNGSLSNLGASQIGCVELFETPIVLATRAGHQNLLGTSAGYISLREIMSKKTLSNKPSAAGDAASSSKGVPLFFYHGLPRASVTGMAGLLQLILVTADGLRVDKDLIAAPSFLEKLKLLESGISSYSHSDVFILNKIAFSGDSAMRFALTTEQQVAMFNKQRAAPNPTLVALYPREGSFTQLYQICMSDVDWVTPAHRTAYAQWVSFLQRESSQRAASQRGFRPLIVKLSQQEVLTKANGVNPELSHTKLEDIRGKVLGQALDLWDDIRRPVAALAVLDVSGSMAEGPLDEAKAVFREFLAKSITADDLSGLVIFSHEAQMVIEPSNDVKKVLSALDQVQAVGGSALYDAIKFSVSHLARPQFDGYRKAIVLITDGDDQNSDMPRVRLLNLLNEKLSFYDINIAILGISKTDVNYKDLAELAQESNIIFREAPLGGLEAVVQEMAANL